MMQRPSMLKTHTYSKKQLTEKPESVVPSTYGMPPPTNGNTASRLAQIDDMKYFLVTATQQWEHNRPLKRFTLPGGESISCVLWDNLFFITGTDIVRSLTFRFHAFGRPVTNAKKFEEGIFSDLRNLKPGHDARLEEPKSELLDMLYKNNCIRTQKKQKVFFWFSVPHDRLFLDALERDLKREKMGLEPTTKAVAEPAASLSLDSTQELFDQLRKNISQSAAATVQSMKEDMAPIPNSSLSLNSVSQVTDHSFLEEDQNWATSPTPTTSHTPWTSTQSELDAQQKRPRVNSVPANIGQQQQLQLLQQKQNRLSHGSYFSGARISSSATYKSRSNRLSSSSSSLLTSPEDLLFRDDASTTTTITDISKSNLSSPLTKYQSDYMDPISNGVNQLEITSSLSNTSHSTTSSILQRNVLPSKSLDSNAMKKTKTIFGNLSLFDGSPTYKLRRRRASSVSTSALNPQQSHSLHATSGGPERIRRHDKCHLRTPSTNGNSNNHHTSYNHGKMNNNGNNLSHISSNIVNSNSSRLAMAAVKAGFAPNQIMGTPPSISMMTTHSHGWPQRQQLQQQQDFYCPVPECRHLFKRIEHLERHMQSLHMFICTVCGKQFTKTEDLAQHHRLEHELQQYDQNSTLNFGDNDDDSSHGDHHHHQQQHQILGTVAPMNQQILNHQGDNGIFTSPRHSFDSSRSSGWSTGISAGNNDSNSSSHSSSRCSTLSPMLDIDFEMSDSQSQEQKSKLQNGQNQQQFQQPQGMINTPLTANFSNTSFTTMDSTTMNDKLLYSFYSDPATSTFVKNDYKQKNQCQNKQNFRSSTMSIRKSSSSLEDDYSSSSASSPCSTSQYKQQVPEKLVQQTNNSSQGYQSTSSAPLPMTLLSPFKLYQQSSTQPQNYEMEQQEVLQQQAMLNVNDNFNHENLMYQPQQMQDQFDLNMDSTMLLNTNTNMANENFQSIYAPYVDQQYTPFITSPDMNIVFGA